MYKLISTQTTEDIILYKTKYTPHGKLYII